MRATTLTIVTEMYKLLNAHNLGVSGGVYKYVRPMDSNKEDIVINSLPITSEYMQKGVLNVNCYVPNFEQGNVPNTARLNEIALKLQAIIQEYWGSNYVFYIENSQTIENGEEFYYNFRVKVNIINN